MLMAFPSWLLVSMGGRRSQRPGPSPTLGSLGPSHQWHHKSRLSLPGLPCAQDVSSTHEEVRNRVCSKNTTFTPLTLFSPEPRWQMTWHVLKAEVLSLKHQPSHRYLVMREGCRAFKSVASGPCDWLLLVLAMKAWGASLTNIDGKIDEWLGIWGRDKNYPNIH